MNKENTGENANALLNAVIDFLQLKNDAALARTLEVACPVISKLRHGRLTVGASLLIRMHEVTGLSFKELRKLLASSEIHERKTSKRAAPMQLAAASTPRLRNWNTRPAHVSCRLLDTLLAKLDLKNDAALARRLEVVAPTISRIRQGRIEVSAAVILRMHEVSGLAVSELRELIQPIPVDPRPPIQPEKNSRRIYFTPEMQQEKLRLLGQIAAERGGQCLADRYAGSHIPLRFTCGKHGIFDAQPRHILNGQWCRFCASDHMKGDASERLLHYVAKRGGSLKSPYINARTHVTVICLKHGEWSVMPDNLLSKGAWCPSCARARPRPGRRKKVETNAV